MFLRNNVFNNNKIAVRGFTDNPRSMRTGRGVWHKRQGKKMWNASTKYCRDGKLSKIPALLYDVVHFLEQKVPRSALTEIEEQKP